MNKIDQHLLGIYRALKIRFDYINQAISHTVTKGSENETEIRRLLLEFLPKNYGIGSGIIIDTEGNQSKQIDIVIYDNTLPNYTLNKDSKIYLLDHVIATIEIKTVFTTGEKGSLRESLENCASVKRLKASTKTWVDQHYSYQEDGLMAYNLSVFSPQPPVSIVFFYTTPKRKRAIDLDFYFGALKKEIESFPLGMQPDLLFSMDHGGFFRHTDIAQIKNGIFGISLIGIKNEERVPVEIETLDDSYKAVINFANHEFIKDSSFLPGLISDEKQTEKALGIFGETLNLDPIVLHTGSIKGKTYLIDNYKAFLTFIYSIEVLLRVKRANKNLFIMDYFPKDFFQLTDYIDGLNFLENSKDS